MKNLKDRLFLGFVKLVFAWTVFALSFQTLMIVTHFTNPELATKVGNAIMWKIDGTFKNDPDNIWYEQPEDKK
jgi:hypothetical protein